MYRRLKSLLRECDAVIVVIFALGVGVVVSCGFMWFTKDKPYTFSTERTPSIVDTMVLSRLQSDVMDARREIILLRDWNRLAVSVITEQSGEIAALRDSLTKLRRVVEAQLVPHVVDIPPAAFGPEPERITPQEIPFPVPK